MNGQLSEQPLVELIREISTQRLDGVLRLRRDAVKVAIYFEAGELIHAAANLRELRLSEYIRKQGLLSDEQLSSIEETKSDLALAAVLNAGGHLDQKAVIKLIIKQVVDILRVALLWPDGNWEFDSRTRLDDPSRVRINVPGLLLQATRKMQPHVVAARLPNQAEVVSPISDPPDSTALSSAEGYLLSRLEGPLSLSELLAQSGLPQADALRTIYGLALGGFVKRDRWPSALRKERSIVPPAPVGQQESTEEATPTEESVHTLAAELKELLERLENAPSYYEVLDVKHEASAEEIKSNYYALARRYHPDRFHMQAGTELHASVESAFAKIAQAYVTLTDPALRSSYNAKLAARERVLRSTISVPKQTDRDRDRLRAEAAQRAQTGTSTEDDFARAESSFQEGFIALQQGQLKAAIINLAAAARLSPTDARFRAYYGHALAAAEDTRRLAETELQAALKLDPENFSYRLMLAELYFDLGFLRRAESELKRVLTAEPNNPGGRNLLRRLEAAAM
jgi:curved DNA-binding protein CbpA